MPKPEAPWVRDFILGELRFAEAPIKRDQLADLVQQQSVAAGCPWKRSTAARRVREAIAELIDAGYPVSSDGSGFRLDATNAARDLALRRIRRMIESLEAKEARLLAGRQMFLALSTGHERNAAGGAR